MMSSMSTDFVIHLGSRRLRVFRRLCLWLSTDLSYKEFCAYECRVLNGAVKKFKDDLDKQILRSIQ